MLNNDDDDDYYYHYSDAREAEALSLTPLYLFIQL